MVGGGENDGGRGVGIRGDPGAVDGKENKKHHQEENHHRPDGGGAGELAAVESWVHCLCLSRLLWRILVDTWEPHQFEIETLHMQ